MLYTNTMTGAQLDVLREQVDERLAGEDCYIGECDACGEEIRSGELLGGKLLGIYGGGLLCCRCASDAGVLWDYIGRRYSMDDGELVDAIRPLVMQENGG